MRTTFLVHVRRFVILFFSNSIYIYIYIYIYTHIYIYIYVSFGDTLFLDLDRHIVALKSDFFCKPLNHFHHLYNFGLRVYRGYRVTKIYVYVFDVYVHERKPNIIVNVDVVNLREINKFI